MIASLAFLACAAPASAALLAETRAAGNVTQESAVIRGYVEPAGLLVTSSFYFEVGTTVAYGAQSAEIPFDAPTTVKAVVTGLKPGTTYHYRVVAKRPLRTVRGADQTFTTLTWPVGPDVGTVTDPLGGTPTTTPTDGSTGTSDSGKDGGSGSGPSDSSGSGTSGSGTSGSGSGGSSGSGSGDSGSSDNSGSGSGDGDKADDDTSTGDDSSSGDRGSGDDSDEPSSNDDEVAVVTHDGESTTPVLGETVGAAPESGSVFVQAPGHDGFEPLPVGAPIPVGTTVDARHGTVKVVTAVAGGEVQAATFHGAVFQIRQRHSVTGLTDIVLRGGDFHRCNTRGRVSVSAARKRHPVRRLWGRDHNGQFRTHGRGAIATVRGTTWVVADYCNGTRTSVLDGSVWVRDRHRHRTTLVHAGHSYFARTAR